MSSILRARIVAALAAALVLWVGETAAQTTGASLSGTVKDRDGRPVAGALVQARSSESGATRTTSTDAGGRYVLPELPAGSWTLVARDPEGTLSDSRTVTLRLQQAGQVDLVVGTGLVEEVVVSGEAPLVDPARVGGELRISGAQTDALPIASRNVTDLALLDSSVRATPPGNFYGERGSVFVINGQSGRSNSFLVDGLDNNDQTSGTTLNAYFSQQVIDQFVVLTHQYAPEFGRATGGILNIVTERGTNEPKGEWFVQGSNARWNDPGRLVDALPETTSRDAVGRIQTGFKIGGPIRKNRAFYFFAYEHQAADEVASYTGVGRDGIAGGRLTAANGDDNVFFRTDVNLGPSNFLMTRVSFDRRTTDGLNVGGVTTPETGFDVRERDWQMAATLTSVLSPTATNELRLLAGSSAFDQDARSSRPGVERPSGVFGGNNLNLQRRDERRIQLVDNLTLLRGDHTVKLGYDVTRARTRVSTRFNPNGNFIYLTDARFEPGDCGDIIAFDLTIPGQIPYCSNDPQRECRRDADCGLGGFCEYPPIPCPGIPGVDDDGDGLVDEPGQLDTYPQVYQLIDGAPRADLRDTRIGLFAQDSWRVSPRWLVDYGLRYDLSTFELPASARVASTVPNGGAGRDWNNVAPRLGFTWTPRGSNRLVVRGGAGVFHDKLVLAFPAVSAITSGTKIGLYFPQGTTVELTEDLVEAVGPDLLRQALFFPDFLTLRFSTGTRLETPYAVQYNVGVEGAVGAHGAWSANVVRALGYHLPLMKDLNPVAVASDPNTALPVHAYDTENVGSIAALVTEGRSWYDGLELGWRWRGEGWWHSVSYTWSKSLDLGPDPLRGGIYLPPRPALRAPGAEYESFAFEKGRSDHDRRHRIVVAGEAPMPWGLRLSAVAQFATAAPFNVTTGRDENVDGITTDRPPGVGRNTGEDTPLEPINELRRRLGLPEVTSLRSPAFVQVDLRFTKPFSYGSRERDGAVYLQVFNVFNRFNGGPIEGRATARAFGEPIGQVGPPRTVEAGLKLAL